MKLHLAFVSALVLGATAAFTPAAFAGTTATVPISGTVASTLNISATATAGASTLNLTSGEKIVKVADLAIDTNNSTGYTLTVSSGNLANPDSATPISYQVKVVDGTATAPASGDFTVASGTDLTDGTSVANGAGTNGKSLYIKYTPAALQDPGNYTGTINLSVADNS
ncbi:hypothetical protein [Iningainema tapete]|uniref:WxL domain-containing protein n=1 Tax=Iningainema tapete BLCC-T55 TaxID=2748662 RepID=A0A8J6XQL8_9CYAN|nr:hypothetical protein [Iningainema tapete]MBD2775596.1 hypothetical protein [Iningainema tapete BLCC-T55]